MIDVDHFKAINDSRGHAAGDTVLRIIASGIAAVVRPYDSVGRCGGEEFLIVAPGLRHGRDLGTGRARAHPRGRLQHHGWRFNGSGQLEPGSGHRTNCRGRSRKLLQAADTALYQAKNAGRNRVEPSVGRAASAGHGPSAIPNRDFWL